MIQPTTYQLRAWERRTATIQRKAQDLMHDMIAALGVEHPLTDHADNVCHEADDLLHSIDLNLRANKLGQP